MKTKVCSRCKEEKSLSKFYKDKSKKSGVVSWCKECRSKKHKEWRKNNPEKVKEINKRFREKNLHYHKEYRMKYPIKDWVYATIANHKRKYKVNIKAKELISLANLTKYCPICNKKLDYSQGKRKLNLASPTIDRINNEKFLNKHNTWIICHQCNTTKNIRNFKQFVNYCTMVSNKFKKEE